MIQQHKRVVITLMPKKSAEERRSHIIGVKVDQDTRDKLIFLAKFEDVKMSTYIYNLLIKHIETLNPFIEKEMAALQKEEE